MMVTMEIVMTDGPRMAAEICRAALPTATLADQAMEAPLKAQSMEAPSLAKLPALPEPGAELPHVARVRKATRKTMKQLLALWPTHRMRKKQGHRATCTTRRNNRRRMSRMPNGQPLTCVRSHGAMECMQHHLNPMGRVEPRAE